MPLAFLQRKGCFQVVFVLKCALSFFLFPFELQAQPTPTLPKTPKVVIDDFMDLRLGMFLHWGPVSLRGTEIGWSRNKEVAQEDYDRLYQEFHPKLFNANTIIRTAKNAGMNYFVITAKHHDGFCLWPFAFTTYDIASTPYKKKMF